MNYIQTKPKIYIANETDNIMLQLIQVANILAKPSNKKKTSGIRVRISCLKQISIHKKIKCAFQLHQYMYLYIFSIYYSDYFGFLNV